MPYVGKTSILINYLMVSYVWTQNQSFATPSTFHVVFLQFDFSESQKVDILYCIYYTCKFSLPYGFSDDLQSHSLWLKGLSYKSHLCGFSPVWTVEWSVTAERELETLPYSFLRFLYSMNSLMNYKAWTQIKGFAILIIFTLNVSHNCSILNILLHYELPMISNMVISNIALATSITFLRFLSYMNCMAVS